MHYAKPWILKYPPDNSKLAGMKIEQLREFIVLAQELNFSSTSEQFFISQPVLSRHIADMEEQLHVKLFHRTPQYVQLTGAGEHFFAECRKIIEMYDEACAQAQLRERGIDCSLRIGVPYFSVNDYIGPFPRYFANDHPNIKLSFLTGTPDDCISRIFEDEVDGSIFNRLPYPNSDRLEFIELYRKPLSLLVNARHPLSGRKSVKLSELKGETFLNVDGVYRQTLLSFFLGKCGGFGFEPKVGNTLYNLTESALMALQIGNDDGVLPAAMDLACNSFSNIRRIILEGDECVLPVGLAFKKDNVNMGIPAFHKCYKSHVNPNGWDL